MSAFNRHPKNRYKRVPGNRKSGRLISLGKPLLNFFCGSVILCLAVGFMGLIFIFVHDFLTQCSYFSARKIIVQGQHKLLPEQIRNQAGIHKSANTLSVNLDHVRQRLQCHPWIRHAEVSRELPSTLTLIIEEQEALAAVDFGSHFLINRQGRLFKKRVQADTELEPAHLPVVSGLHPDDLAPRDNRQNADLNAVMAVISSGEKERSILPNRLIDRIHIDKDTGLTLSLANTESFYPLGKVLLGFDNYSLKYERLEQVLAYLKSHDLEDRDHPLKLEYIDLNQANRIVARPAKIELPAGKDKEV